MPLEPSLGTMRLAQLHIQLWLSSFRDTTKDNPSEKVCFVPSIINNIVTYSPIAMALTSCHKPGLNLQPLNKRVGALTTQPVRIAKRFGCTKIVSLSSNTRYTFLHFHILFQTITITNSECCSRSSSSYSMHAVIASNTSLL